MEELLVSNAEPEVKPKLRDEKQLTLLVALLHAMFKQVDVNGNGLLEWHEFTGWCVSVGLLGAADADADGGGGGGHDCHAFVETDAVLSMLAA